MEIHGIRLEWAGQFKYFEQTKSELTLLVPLTLAIFSWCSI